jgi:hypothetical protein
MPHVEVPKLLIPPSGLDMPRRDIPKVRVDVEKVNEARLERNRKIDSLMNRSGDYADTHLIDSIIHEASQLEKAAAAALQAKMDALKRVRNAIKADVDNAQTIADAATDALLAVENAQTANAANNIATQEYLQNITPGQARAEEWIAEADWNGISNEVAMVQRVMMGKHINAVNAASRAERAKIIAAEQLAKASELAGSKHDGEKTFLQNLLEKAKSIIQGIPSAIEMSSTLIAPSSSSKTAFVDPNLVVATADEALREATALMTKANGTDKNVEAAQLLVEAVDDMNNKVRVAIDEGYYSPRQMRVAGLEALRSAASAKSPRKPIPTEIKAKEAAARAAVNEAVRIANSNNVGEETPIQNMLNNFRRMFEGFIKPKAASPTPVAASPRPVAASSRTVPASSRSGVQQRRELSKATRLYGATRLPDAVRLPPPISGITESGLLGPLTDDAYTSGGKGSRRRYNNYKKTGKRRVNKIYSKRRKTNNRRKTLRR